MGNSLQGHSGLIQHLIDPNSDPDYASIFVPDISANVADNDEAGVVIAMEAPIRVFEHLEGSDADHLVHAVYSVVLTRSPEEEVRVTASPSLPRESESAAGGEGVLLKRKDEPDSAASAQGVALLFDRTAFVSPWTPGDQENFYSQLLAGPQFVGASFFEVFRGHFARLWGTSAPLGAVSQAVQSGSKVVRRKALPRSA